EKPSEYNLNVGFGIAQMLRWSTSIYFDDILLEITKMRDIPESEDIDGDDYLYSSIEQAERDLLFKGTIRKLEVKWKMLGTKNATFFNPQPRIRYIEGVFVYTFDDDGLIGEHRIQRIVPPPSRRVLWLHSWGVRLRSLFWEKRAPLLNPGF
ncbi:hypothetical protein BDF20DRAFT_805503, partial [Mycotypha africana]|uniref:uncharacterized protein n=1 Tax=Mycotypha africana TaxID=64632 RepID=UPI0022FFC4A7